MRPVRRSRTPFFLLGRQFKYENSRFLFFLRRNSYIQTMQLWNESTGLSTWLRGNVGDDLVGVRIPLTNHAHRPFSTSSDCVETVQFMMEQNHDNIVMDDETGKCIA